jgi:two-component system sensor kinase FixL
MDETLEEDGWTAAATRRLRRSDRLISSENSRRLVGAAILIFLGYFFGAQLGFALTFKPHPVSVLWPPNSILLAALLLTPPRAWWLMLLAAFPAHCLVELQSHVPPGMVFCWFISNSCEALIGAASVRYFIEGPIQLNRLRDVAVFCCCGVFLGPFLSSFLDAAFVAVNHWGGDTYWEVWRLRVSSNALAGVIITPLILAWAGEANAPRQRMSRATLLEAGVLMMTLLALGFILFNWLTPDTDVALLYAPLPLLLWAAIRFGTPGATTAIAAIALLAIWGATHGHGPFVERPAKESALYVQIFLSFISLPLLFLAALTEERKETGDALREREERISLAAETAHLALWTIHFEGGHSWMNDVGRELFGFSPNEHLSREVFLAHVHPEDRERVAGAIDQARNASQRFELEYRVQRENGETRWLISRGCYLRNNHGQTSELLGVALDLTRQVRANLELRQQQQELARLSRVAVMGELTASLAHELNQPLAAIASNAAAAKRFLASAASVDPTSFREILEDIFTDARRAGAVIHGIRQFIRKGEETRCSVSLNDVIEDVLQLLHSDLVSRAVRIEKQTSASLPAVQADPVQMQQVLINLIVNSLEAMQEVAPERQRIIISSHHSNGSARVAVRDFGVGLPKDNPEKVFSHFFSTKPDGMGMGLAIARSIVEAHGGELTAESLSDGSRFSFSLPIKKVPGQSSSG